MGTPTSRLAELVRRKRGVMQMPEMDLTRPTAGDTLTVDDINSVGAPRVDLPPVEVSQADLTADPRLGQTADRAASGATFGRLEDGGPGSADWVAASQAVAPAQNSIPALAAKTVTAAAPPVVQPSATNPASLEPVQRADDSLRRAAEADRDSQVRDLIVLAGRQFVGGVTHTPVAEGMPKSSNYFARASETEKTKRQMAAEALKAQREGVNDAAGNDLKAAEAAKARAEALKAGQAGQEKPATPTNTLGEDTLAVRRDVLEFNKKKEAAREAAMRAKQGHGGAPSADLESNADAVANYKGPPPSLRDMNYDAKMAAVRKVNPDYDPARWHAYEHTLSNQATNSSLIAIKTAYTHMKEARGAMKELGNSQSPAWNKVANWASQQSGDPRTNRARTALHAVGLEAAKAYEANDKEGRDSVVKLTDSNASPEQIDANLKELETLLGGKEHAFSDSINSLGPTKKSNPSGTPDIPSASVKIRRTSDGVVKSVSAAAAKELLTKGGFEAAP